MKLLATIALGMVVLAHAQQQTGASGGIAVAPAPESSTTAPASDNTAQDSHSFRIRLLDGRNGSPVAGGHVKLWYDEPSGSGYILATNGRGVALMPAPVGQPVRILVRSDGAVDCRHAQRYSPPIGYNLADIAAKGTAAENTCGDVAVRIAPGELVLFVRPQRWYEKLNQNPPTNVP
ncbi:hypothetical protein [Terriglobus roseus]|uniref:Uncharacterized protein n=1 Tax=Terriglobus roseus TaxID=392734 RepID=A0A1G7K1X5_9BACT|nr:hypothetical protein [Terriglobus roseus]SDF31253.1 hypothetical protein SAMN05444167_2032 [Terriglobus roseus]